MYCWLHSGSDNIGVIIRCITAAPYDAVGASIRGYSCQWLPCFEINAHYTSNGSIYSIIKLPILIGVWSLST